VKAAATKIRGSKIDNMKIPNEKIEEIASASDIIDIVSSYIHVKKRGKSFLALCPFHPDKNPSLHISQEKQVYHCFSCKASGNVFSFIQNYEKITFIDAVRQLAERAGIDLRISERSPDLTNEVSTLFEINKAALKFFRKSLLESPGAEQEFVRNYLKERKINNETVEKFKIGYAPKGWNSLLNFFIEEGIFKTGDVEKAGLILKGDNGYYDRFRGRLIFPVLNENDKVAAFGGRQLYEEDKQGGKYINSPETKVYNKSKILYGLNFAKNKIRFFDYVILVEGYMDIVSLAQYGIENTVASSGTALTEEQVRLISRYTKNIILLFDSDLAGIKAAKRGIELVLEAGLDLNIIALPDNEDPDSFIHKHGKEKFDPYIERKKSVINFISELYEKEGKLSTVDDKTNFIKEIIGYIGKIPDAIKRAFYIKETAKLYSLYESDLRGELEKIIKQTRQSSFPKTSLEIPRNNVKNGNGKKLRKEEHDLVDIFVNGNEKAIEYLERELEISFIKDNTVRKIIEMFLDDYMNEGKIEVSKVMSRIEDENARILITKIAIEKHEISQIPERQKNQNIKFSESADVDYLRFAKDVIRKFKLIVLEEKRSELKKDPANFKEILELGRQIDSLHKRLTA
jgi:DNA primase